MTAEIKHGQLGREIVKSTRWNTLSLIFQNLFQVITVVVLARHLEPDHYGQAAIALSVYGLFSLLAQFGFSAALVGIRQVEKETVDTVFTFTLVLTALLYSILALVAPFLADHYENLLLTEMLRWTGLGLFSASFSALGIALLQRQLNYFGQMVANSLNSAIILVVALSLLKTHYGVWPLLIPMVVGHMVSALTSFGLARHLPRPCFQLEQLRRCLNFGISGFVSNICNFFCNNAIPLAMGKIWSPAILGYFQMATSSNTKVFHLMTGPLFGNIFPIFSKIASDLDRLRQTYLRLLRLSLFYLLPTLIAIVIAAETLILGVFGEKWGNAVLPFQILTLISIFRLINIGTNPALYALQKPHISARIVVLRLGLYVITLAFSYVNDFGLIKTITAFSLAELGTIFLYLTAGSRAMTISLREWCASTWSPIALSLVFGCSFYAVHQLGQLFIPHRLGLIACLMVFGVLYLAALTLFLSEIKDLIKKYML